MVLLTDTVICFVFLFLSTASGIWDGWNATPNQFPYQALIDVNPNNYTDVYDSGVWKCSGAVISERFVITSAYCVYGLRKFRIRLGAHFSGNITEDLTYDYITRSDPYYAPGFVPNNTEHDLALIRLDTTIIFTPNIQPVTLPKIFNKLTDVTYLHHIDLTPEVIATGWGPNSKSSHELQWLKMRLIPNSKCIEYFPNNLFNNTLCAHGEDKLGNDLGSVCNDIGAPLVLKSDSRTLVGIYQFSRPRCHPGGPDGFARIESYVNWIKQTADIR